MAYNNDIISININNDENAVIRNLAHWMIKEWPVSRQDHETMTRWDLDIEIVDNGGREIDTITVDGTYYGEDLYSEVREELGDVWIERLGISEDEFYEQEIGHTDEFNKEVEECFSDAIKNDAIEWATGIVKKQELGYCFQDGYRNTTLDCLWTEIQEAINNKELILIEKKDGDYVYMRDSDINLDDEAIFSP